MSRIPDSFLDELRARVAVSAVVGRAVKLSKVGREFEGLCPFHGERTPSFRVADDKGFWHCFGCNQHGDQIGFLMQHFGLSFRDAVAELAADAGMTDALTAITGHAPAPRRLTPVAPVAMSPRATAESDRVSSHAMAAALWASARPVTSGEDALSARFRLWFRGRGLPSALVDRLCTPRADKLGARMHAAAPFWPWKKGQTLAGAMEEAERNGGHMARAMLWPIIDPLWGTSAGLAWPETRYGLIDPAQPAIIGLHVTWLDRRGPGKARFFARDGKAYPARKILGSVAGGGVCLLVPHGAPADDKIRVLVGEGIESTLSALESLARPFERRAVGGNDIAVWVALSLGNLQGRALKERMPRAGSQMEVLPLWNLRHDPSAAQFVLPDVDEAIIAIDADMKPVMRPLLVQAACAGPVVERPLSQAEVVKVCADLTASCWRGAGAGRVRVIRPPMGQDFNDAQQERVS